MPKRTVVHLCTVPAGVAVTVLTVGPESIGSTSSHTLDRGDT